MSESISELISKLKEAHEFVEAFKSAVLSGTVIRIKNSKGDVVWCCADGEWRDSKFEGYEVDQDMNLYEVIANLEKLP